MSLRHLYKFRDWNDQYHKKLLVNSEIFFTSPANFNDPFDSTIPFRYDLGKEEDFYQRYIFHLTREHPNYDREKIEQLAQLWMEKGIYNDPDNINYYKEYYIKKRHETFGVFSTSADFRNILLWSHYANSHKGFCVEFNVEQFDKYFEENYKKLGIVVVKHKVIYRKSQPVLNPFKMEEDKIVLESLINKSIVWKYEKEYRYISHDGSNISINIDEGVITKVILGCKISEKNKMEIIDTLKKRKNKPELIEAIRDEFSFNLSFQNLNY